MDKENGIVNSMNSIRIFTDGASRGNPGPGGWGALVAFDDRVIELGGREEPTTNNRMELSAVIGGLDVVLSEGETDSVTVYTDSSYVVNGATKWSKSWIKRGWTTANKEPVLNKDLWVKLVSQTEKLEIDWFLLPGHSGIPGNERADIIATAFADKSDIQLFHGTLSSYPVDITNVTPDKATQKARSEKKSRAKAKAYSYLSLVDGILMRHTTWATCEARVKGKSARFKKALSPEEEVEVVESK